MVDKGKQALKRVEILRALVGFARQLQPTWNNVRSNLNDEKKLNQSLNHRQQVIDSYLSQDRIKKLQVGAGTNPLSGWLNSDFEPTSEEIIFLDATQTFPFGDNEFDYVFSEHMIEHIPYKEGMFMMKEIYRVLKPGGKARIATPDIEKIVGLFSPQKQEEQKRYIEWKANQIMGLYSPEPSRLQTYRKEWDIDYRHVNRYYPIIDEDGVCFIVNNFFHGYGHQYLYDARSLQAIAKEAGFIEITMCRPNESDDEHLRSIESHASLIGEEMNDFETMVLQAIRPR